MKKYQYVYSLAFLAMVSFGGLAQAQALNSRETQALSSATVSLSQAVEIGEKQGLGKSVGVEFDIERGRGLWEVKVLSASGLQEFKVDAISGQVIQVEDEHLRGRLTNFVTGMNLKDLEAVKTTLAQAVAMAESQAKGKAVKVQVEHERGGVQFEVFMRVGDDAKKMKIDATSGKALQ
jgi:uncharacterized membrane protein YkoI